MNLTQEDLNYFKRGIWQNPQFWKRFGGQPDFNQATVLDVGCGHGSMAIYVAQANAKSVVGLDINCKLIDFANANLKQNYPNLASQITFNCLDLCDYPEDTTFDYIISKDSFEHFLNLPEMLSEMRKHLKPGGRIYAGFGPLYNSPFGDHEYAKSRIPWRHLLLGEEGLVDRVNRRWGTNHIHSLHDLGLNGLALADYEHIFNDSGLSVIYFRTNRSEKPVSKLFALPASVSFLREYFTFNVYVVLEKPPTK